MSRDDDEILAVAREGFLDEAGDMLRQFEQALLVMEEHPQDSENLNAAFRAAHTIKGTAGLFGFEAVVAFTHEAETLLEHLRSGTLAVDEHVTQLLLRSRDQMEALLDEVRTGARDAAVAEVSRTLGAELRAAAQAAGGQPVEVVAEAPALQTADAVAAGPWLLSLRFGPDALRNGLDPLAFLRYLESLGRVAGIRLLTEHIPSLAALDPESCHIGVELRFDSAASRQDIEQVFEFCADDCDIAILEPQADASQRLALLERRAPQDEALHLLLSQTWQSFGFALAPAQEAVQGAAPPPTIDPVATPVAPSPVAATPAPAAPVAAAAAPARRPGDDTRFIRVRADKLDHLIDLIGELVIASSGAQLVAQQEASAAFMEAALRIEGLVEEARDGALGLRMVPVGDTFSRFQRVVRDLGKQLGKDVELVITGGDTELDKSMVEVIADPLMHLVRNSMDHGLETPEGRQAAGKPAAGKLRLNAYHEAGAIVIEVGDDGRGLNRERILAKAIERGLVPAHADLADEDVDQLIFLPGFSTAEQVTNVSGRGVGMDVVKRNIESLRGQIRVYSRPGKGATMQIRLPLTLAMIDGFLTQVGGVCYVLPLEIVSECIDVPEACSRDAHRVSGCFDLRGEVLPWLDVAAFYRHAPAPQTPNGRRSLVIVRDGMKRVGLIVDRLMGEHQTVLKPLSPIFRHLRAIAGSTILGSGEVALVLDVPALVSSAVLHTTRSFTPPPHLAVSSSGLQPALSGDA
ncbi:chemotaxis protein CheA [Ideonella sp. 4Y11]|uniref:Chemotaxis protein CheA n=1 Tax=Ideonella aquatica TaxID=2824119 RepID=A0A940YHA0_9BURK|nr:chemotaxis protein CheA [Ideonella aquatica]MBQ0958712.1 chemotaxis protein CheA [Ideonella aquatica]